VPARARILVLIAILFASLGTLSGPYWQNIQAFIHHERSL